MAASKIDPCDDRSRQLTLSLPHYINRRQNKPNTGATHFCNVPRWNYLRGKNAKLSLQNSTLHAVYGISTSHKSTPGFVSANTMGGAKKQKRCKYFYYSFSSCRFQSRFRLTNTDANTAV